MSGCALSCAAKVFVNAWTGSGVTFADAIVNGLDDTVFLTRGSVQDQRRVGDGSADGLSRLMSGWLPAKAA
jgi:hypothetical protein